MPITEKYLLLTHQDLKTFIDSYTSILFKKLLGVEVEYVEATYPQIRRAMKEKGAKTETLDNLECHLKKTIAGVIEPDTEKASDLTLEIAKEIILWAEGKEKSEGKNCFCALALKTMTRTERENSRNGFSRARQKDWHSFSDETAENIN